MPTTIVTRHALYDCENEAVLAAVITTLNQQRYLTDHEASLIQQEADGMERLAEGIARIGQHPNIQP